ncbi:MAG: integrase arm-type DNA-binding domain-containing protein [Cyanobacteria bacterium SZAS-4]|nr:integrase arm-type DNA-binding domain-containing protein [Cyanobacteria bacterium SZAS-4]
MRERINFTRAIIESLPGPTGNNAYVFYYDDKVDALTMRVGRTGTRHFVYYKRILGNPMRFAIGPYPDLSIEQARNKALELNAAVARGEDPMRSKREITQIPTLGAIFETYIEEYAKSHCKTWEVMVYCFERYLGHWRNEKLDTIMRTDVQALVNRLGRENGRATANRTFELLRAVINRAKSLEIYLGENPANGVAKFKLQSRDRFLQSDELPRLFASLDVEKPLIRHFVYLCLLTGARRSNVAAMRWEEINFAAKTWRMPDSKNGQPHTVPLVPKAMEILLEREQSLNKTEWVFPGSGKTGHLTERRLA